MKLILSKILTIEGAPSVIVDNLRGRLAIENPQWLDNEKMNRWNGNTPRYLRYFKATDRGIIVPRGSLGHVIGPCKQTGTPYQIDDRRRLLEPVEFEFKGNLRSFQKDAVDAMLRRDFGVLTAPTGSGKTVMALSLIAERKQPALIVVHTTALLNQWVERIDTFLGIPKSEIGVIGGGKKTVGEKITVATVQSLVKVADDVSPSIGHLIIDECHHCPSKTFTDVVTAFDSKYILGLSATPWRRDGLSKLIFWFVGDVVHEIGKAGLVSTGNVLPFEVLTIETSFASAYDASAEYSKMLSELTTDPCRNGLIADTVAQGGNDGASLILSDRKAHCDDLQRLLARRGVSAEVLTGDCGVRKRKDIINRLNAGLIKTVIATGSLIGEGFDCPALSTLYVATPVAFDGRLLQYIGRVLRPAPGKTQAHVVDFVDSRIGVLKSSAAARRRVYARA